jgi:hypothetical protein
VGETSPVMRRNIDGGPRILTKGFDGRLDCGNGLVEVDSGGGDFYSVRNCLEDRKANVGVARHCGNKNMGARLHL